MLIVQRLRQKNEVPELNGETDDVLKEMSTVNLHHLYVKSQNELRAQREKNIIGGQDY